MGWRRGHVFETEMNTKMGQESFTTCLCCLLRNLYFCYFAFMTYQLQDGIGKTGAKYGPFSKLAENPLWGLHLLTISVSGNMELRLSPSEANPHTNKKGRTPTLPSVHTAFLPSTSRNLMQ
jgi:hypothetical protein